MQDYLPQVRCTSELRSRLKLIADQSLSSDLSDHIRAAVEQYVKANWSPELASKLQIAQGERETASAY